MPPRGWPVESSPWRLPPWLSRAPLPWRTPRRAAGRPRPAPVGTSVVVIDIAYIFKNHIRFNRMNDIKRDIEQFEAYVREETTEAQDEERAAEHLQGQLAGIQANGRRAARMQSDLQIEVQLKRKEFLEPEAKLYYRIYREVEQNVAVFAQRIGSTSSCGSTATT